MKNRLLHKLKLSSFGLVLSISANYAQAREEPLPKDLTTDKPGMPGQVKDSKEEPNLEPSETDKETLGEKKLTVPETKESKAYKAFTEADVPAFTGADGKKYVSRVDEATDHQPARTVTIELETYLKELNEVEKDLVKRGYSLRDEVTERVLSKVAADDELRAKNEAMALAAKLKEASDFLKAQNDVKAAAEAYVNKQKAEAAAQLEAVAAKLGIDKEKLQEFSFKKLTPEQTLNHKHDLVEILSKHYRIDAGDKKSLVSLAAEADLSIKGSMPGVSALAAAWVDGQIYNQTGNILYAGIYGGVEAGKKKAFAVSNQGKLLVLGKEINHWSFDNVDAGTDKGPNLELKKVVRVSKKYLYTIGPVPVTSEIGFEGDIEATPSFGAKELGLSIGIVPNLALSGFMNAAIDYVVAKAGVEVQLIILNEQLSFMAYGQREIDPITSERVLKFGVSGDSVLTALKGALKAYAEVNLANLIKKKYQTVLFEYPGIVLSKAKLFQFEKTVSQRGTKLSGAPQKEDVEEVNAEEGLKLSFAEGYELANDETNARVLYDIDSQIHNYHKSIQDTRSWLAQLKAEVK